MFCAIIDKPRIQADYSDREHMIAYGTAIKLEVKVTGHPAPVTTWDLNGSVLDPNEDIQINTEDGKSVLLIRQASLEHSGTYTVTAENIAGANKLDIPVLITGKHLYSVYVSFC